MTRVAYLDLIGGISGDMLLSAMLALADGCSPPADFRQALESELARIVPVPFRLVRTDVTRGAIAAVHIDVEINAATASGSLSWRDFYGCIDASDLPSADKAASRAVFDCLRTGEAVAHGGDAAAQHLHELGSFDTLIDIAGAVIGLRLLGVKRVYASPLPASVGMSSSSHGRNASIAPATAAIIRQHGLPMRVGMPTPPAGESITPTGAAIVAALTTRGTADMRVDAIGYGAGTRDSDTPPNVVGLWLGDAVDDSYAEAPAVRVDASAVADSIGAARQSDVVLMETNLDDMTGEAIGFATARLFEAGALDVWTTPIQMKKSRPAVTLSAIVREPELAVVSAAFFAHTTTLGVRWRRVERFVAAREIVSVATGFGEVQVKLRRIGGEVTQAAPEYDDCARLATEHGAPLAEVMAVAQAAVDEAAFDESAVESGGGA